MAEYKFDNQEEVKLRCEACGDFTDKDYTGSPDQVLTLCKECAVVDKLMSIDPIDVSIKCVCCDAWIKDTARDAHFDETSGTYRLASLHLICECGCTQDIVLTVEEKK